MQSSQGKGLMRLCKCKAPGKLQKEGKERVKEEGEGMYIFLIEAQLEAEYVSRVGKQEKG